MELWKALPAVMIAPRRSLRACWPTPRPRPRPTLGAARPWITAACVTAQRKARFARRYPPTPQPTFASRALSSFCADRNPGRLTHPARRNIIPSIRGGRRQVADIKSEPRPASIGIGGRRHFGMHGRLRRNPHAAVEKIQKHRHAHPLKGLRPAHLTPPKKAKPTGQIVRYLNRTYRVLATLAKH